MAEKILSNRNDEGEQERKIPVFTVIKNSSILKNIFLIDKPPSSPYVSKRRSVTFVGNEENTYQEDEEEILTVGRHPDCHIMLTHPSISRFHLQILSRSSAQKLSVIDMSSVHGTWVSEKRIEPGVQVELNEGDTLRLGGSTRVYRLHWVPLTRAYDMDNPFISPLDVSIADVKVEEPALLEDEQKAEKHEGENSATVANKKVELSQGRSLLEGEQEYDEHTCQYFASETKNAEVKEFSLLRKDERTFQDNGYSASDQHEPVQSLDSILEGIVSLFSDENLAWSPEQRIPSSGIKSLDFSLPVDEAGSITEQLQFDNDFMTEDTSGRGKLKLVKVLDEIKNQTPLQINNETSGVLKLSSNSAMKEYMNISSLVSEEVVLDTESQQISKEHQIQEPFIDLQPLTERLDNDNSLHKSLKFSSNSAINEYKSISSLVSEEVVLDTESQQISKEHQTREPSIDLQPLTERLDNDNSLDKSLKLSSNSAMKEYMNISSLVSEEVVLDTESQQISKEHQTREPSIDLQPLTERLDNDNSLDQSLKLSSNSAMKEYMNISSLVSEEVVLDTESQQICKEHQTQEPFIDLEPLTERLDGNSLDKSLNCSVFHEAVSVNSSLPAGEILSEIRGNKENDTPQSHFALAIRSSEQENLESPVRSEKRHSLNSIWSRRGKKASAIQIQTVRSSGKRSQDQENAGVKLLKQEDSESKSLSRTLFSGLNEVEEGSITPDKENISPNTLLLKSLKRKGMLEENKQYSSCRTSNLKFTSSPIIQLEDSTDHFEKENVTPRTLEEKKAVKHASRNQGMLKERTAMQELAERVPFQSLVENSTGKMKTEASDLNAPMGSSNSVNLTRTLEKFTSVSSSAGGRRKWTMIVDASSLLDKKSRKALQLMQGLRGTQLVIPRMVMRELEHLKMRGGLFRRSTEVFSSLEWIEECMMKTNWWIHIQNSEEDSQIAPTPPAFPQPHFSDESTSSFSFTSFMEIVSPTAEDRILDFALQFRKTMNGRGLVLLSNDVTLKIKAMAEGLICETAEEFRESLVNPFSDRFMWSDSSPRGLTWSHLDDVVLREKYSQWPLKKPSKGGDSVKGLKLILLHNSSYNKKISLVR